MGDRSTAVDIGVHAVAHRGSVPSVRHLVGAWLHEHAIDGHLGDELLLVVTELVTNAIEASRSPGSRVDVVARLTDHTILVDVVDDGDGFDLDESTGLPGPDSVRGRGLAIVRALTDDVRVGRVDDRTMVRVERSLA